jgi:hypothetical protein
MKSGGEQQGLAEARLQVERACDLLTHPSPEHLDRGTELLQAAAGRLARIVDMAIKGGPEMLAEARHIRVLVLRAAALLEKAAVYHRKWMQMAGVMSSGYRPGGEPGEVMQAGRLCVRG